MTKFTRIVAVLALSIAAVVSATTSEAHAADATGPNVPRSWVKPGQIEPPVMEVPRAELTITYLASVEGTRWMLAEFNDGRLFVFRPCRGEDGRRCFWDATARGNGVGDSWVRYGGRTYLWADVPRHASI